MNQSVNPIFDLDEGAKVRQVSDATLDARADLITVAQSLPWVLLNLLHAETDATRFRIDPEHFNVDRVTRVDNLAGVLHSLGPAHLRNVDQTLDPGFELDKRAVVSDACNLPINPRSRRKTFLDRLPGIGQQLFVTQRDAFTPAIKPQHFDLNRIANLEGVTGILQP